MTVGILLSELSDFLIAKGAWKVGVGNLTALPQEQRHGFPRGVSILVDLDLSVINGLGKGITTAFIEQYETKNRLLDSLALAAADWIKARGFDAFPQTKAAVNYNYCTGTTLLPHKTVATCAGLGWIGKNALLITPELGSAVRLTSVLTDAPFAAAVPTNESKCGNCMACVNNCPGEAPLGTNWSVTSQMDDFFNMHACRKVCLERSWLISPGMSACSLCVLICPWTKRAIEQSGLQYNFPVVEIARMGDLEEILALQKLAFRQVAISIDNFTIPPLLQTFDSIKKEFINTDKPVIFLKIVEDRRIVGSVRAYESGENAFITRLIVHPDYQKKGYGKKLLAAIESCYHSHRFELFTGAETTDAIRFYQALGYKIFRTEEATDQPELVYLEKGISFSP